MRDQLCTDIYTEKMSFQAKIFNSTFLSRIEIFLSNIMAVQMSMTQHHIHFQKKEKQPRPKVENGGQSQDAEHYLALLSPQESVELLFVLRGNKIPLINTIKLQ